MKTRKRIVVLSHENGMDLWDSNYYMRIFAELWRDQGHDVVCINGPRESVRGDIVIAHVDLTVVPQDYRDYIKSFPRAINGETVDISKHLFSDHLLNPRSRWNGQVIVKTRANFGGIPESGSGAGIEPHPLGHGANARPWRKVETLDPYNYPIFDSIAAVPLGVWKNPRLLAQKFLPERDQEGIYYVRNWYFLGERGIHCWLRSTRPVVKAIETEEDEAFCLNSCNDPEFQAQEVPPILHRVRQLLRVDYGVIDWGICNGEAVVYDVNKTPTLDAKFCDDPAYIVEEKENSQEMSAELRHYL